MTDISKAIEHLKSYGIESFELMGVLIIPVSSPNYLDRDASKIKHYLKEIGYEKSWSLNPYYYDKQSLED